MIKQIFVDTPGQGLHEVTGKVAAAIQASGTTLSIPRGSRRELVVHIGT